MARRYHFWCKHLLLWPVALVLVALAAFVFWIGYAPRSLPFLERKIESYLNHEQSRFVADIGGVVVQWDGWGQWLNLHIRDIVLRDAQGVQLLDFPDAVLDIDVASLLYGGRFVVEDLSFNNLEIYLPGSEEEEANAAAVRESAFSPQRALYNFIQFFHEHASSLPLQQFSFHDTIVFSADRTRSFRVPELTGKYVLSGEFGQVTVKGFIDYGNTVAGIALFGYVKRGEELHLKMKMTGMTSGLCAMMSSHLEWIERAEFTINGNVELVIQPDGSISDGTFDIATQEGLSADVMKNQEPSSQQFRFTGKYFFPEEAGVASDAPEMRVDGIAFHIPAQALSGYWPPAMAPETRKWIMEHITQGIVESAALNLHLLPEHTRLEKLGEGTVDAKFIVKDAKISIKEGFPAIHVPRANIRFDWNNGYVEADEATYLGVRIAQTAMDMQDLMGNTHFRISAPVEGPIEDVATVQAMLQPPREKVVDAEDEGGLDYTGQFKGLLNLAFTYEYTETYNDALLQVGLDGDLSSFSINNIAGFLQLDEGAFTLKTENNRLELAGKAKVSGAPAEVRYATFLAGGKEPDAFDVTLTVSERDFPVFQLPALPGVVGNFRVSAKGELADGSLQSVAITLDGAGVAFGNESFAWNKPAGEPWTLRADYDRQRNPSLVFDTDSATFRIGGDASISDARELSVLRITEAVTPRDNFSLEYRKEGSAPQLSITAKELNAVPLLDYWKNSVPDDKEINLVLKAKADVLHVTAKENLLSVEAEIECAQVCERMDIKARDASVTGRPNDIVAFYQSLRNARPRERTLRLLLPDAGRIYGAFFSDGRITGGELDISLLKVDDRKAEGGIILKKFTIRNTPVLAKLLNVASFTGLMQLLSNDGVFFDKLSSRLTMEEDTLFFADMKSSGNAMGLIAEGRYNMENKQVQVSGTLIPSYSLNSVLGNVPVVGNLLMGGEGQGIVGVNFSLEGAWEEAEITVNPLSVLTPGFLRNLWGIN